MKWGAVRVVRVAGAASDGFKRVIECEAAGRGGVRFWYAKRAGGFPSLHYLINIHSEARVTSYSTSLYNKQ